MALAPRALALGLAAALVSCTTQDSPPAVPPESARVEPTARAAAITRVALTPKAVRIDRGESVAIRFELTAAARVVVEIDDELGRRARELELGERAPGKVEATWDGRDDAGRPVASGVYFYGIRATDAAGSTSVAEIVPSGGGEVFAQRFTLDRETGTMRFVLPQTSRVRLRVGIQGLPHLQTLRDWTPMLAGAHEVEWNGLDPTGQIQLLKHEKLAVDLSAFALAGNSILVESGEPIGRGPSGSFAAEPPVGGYRHSAHAPEICHEPRFRAELLGAEAGVVDGIVPVRVTLDRADEAHLLDTRFEVMFFVDTVFLFEEEEGSSPFTWHLDTRPLTPGAHVLTVNVLSYDDHIGSYTVEFVKKVEE